MPRQLQNHERIKRFPLGSQLISTGGTKTWKISSFYFILRIKGVINSFCPQERRSEQISHSKDYNLVCFIFFQSAYVGITPSCFSPPEMELMNISVSRQDKQTVVKVTGDGTVLLKVAMYPCD